MKEIFNFLDSKEKKILASLCLLLVVALAFLSFISFGRRSASFRASASLSLKKQQYAELDASRLAQKMEWEQWLDVPRDLDDLKNSNFYEEREGIEKLRLDLQQIFSESGINVSQIRYDYVDFEKERVKKVTISFNFSGTYLFLRNFLESVERFPKFLVMEKIDFLNVDAQDELMELKIVLAGYYEI